MTITPKQRKILEERDPYCLHCADDSTLQVHHRKGRGMGGRPKKSLDRLDNLLRVCAWLNYQMEADWRVASNSHDMGWKLKQSDDFSTPVFDNLTRTWYQLTEDGRKVETKPPQYLV